MRIKKPYKSKSLKSRTKLRSYSGEDSPYWEFMEEHQASSSEGKIVDDPLANPDVFAEDDSVFSRPLTAVGEFQLDALHEVLPSLSPQQRRVVQLCGFEGQTLEVAANILGIKVATVQVLLQRARARIQRHYDQRLKAE